MRHIKKKKMVQQNVFQDQMFLPLEMWLWHDLSLCRALIC